MKIGTFKTSKFMPISADERKNMVEHFTNVAKSFFADLVFVESYELYEKHKIDKANNGDCFCMIFAFPNKGIEFRNICKDRVTANNFCVQVHKRQDENGLVLYSASAWVVGYIKRYKCRKAEETHLGCRAYDFDTELSNITFGEDMIKKFRTIIMPKQ